MELYTLNTKPELFTSVELENKEHKAQFWFYIPLYSDQSWLSLQMLLFQLHSENQC